MEFTKSITAKKIVTLMSKMFVTHGLPFFLRAENGTQFISDHFKRYLEKTGIEHKQTAPLWPQANKEIERKNPTILKSLRIAQAGSHDWRLHMDDFLMMFRSTLHSTTGVISAKLLFGGTISTKLLQLQEFTREKSSSIICVNISRTKSLVFQNNSKCLLNALTNLVV